MDLDLFFDGGTKRLIRYVNIPKKTKDLMLITYLNPTYLWCFSPDPIFTRFTIYETQSTNKELYLKVRIYLNS